MKGDKSIKFISQARFTVFLSTVISFFLVLGVFIGYRFEGFESIPRNESQALDSAMEIRAYLESHLNDNNAIETIKLAKKMGKKQNLIVVVDERTYLSEYQVDIHWEVGTKTTYITSFAIAKDS